MTEVRWGLVATIKASTRDTLNWAAHHLDLGAAHLHIYLDASDPEAEAALGARPDVTVITTDAAYWKMRRPREEHRRPPTHQGRQFANAKWAYMHTDLDWIAHIDVDEFLFPGKTLSAELAALPRDCLCARLRPLEVLSSKGVAGADPKLTYFKSCADGWLKRLEETAAIYPTFGTHLNGGFLSHVSGKLFVRTGLPDMKIHIHNVVQNGVENPGERPLPGTDLLHLHARSFAAFKRHLGYRMRKGSYRAELAPPTQPPGAPRINPHALTMHALFAALAQDPEGLRAFYDEVCTATPELRSRLAAHGHLRAIPFAPGKARKHMFG